MPEQYKLFGTDIKMLPLFADCLKTMPDINKELIKLKEDLWDNPKLGTKIKSGIHKIRLPISSLNRGKSYGARVITVVKTHDARPIVYLLFVYSKSEIKDIPRSQLIKIARKVGIID